MQQQFAFPRLRQVAGVALVAALITALAGAPAVAAPPAPSPPTSAAQADQAKQAADRQVASVQSRIAAAVLRLRGLTSAAGRAEDQYNAALTLQANARAADQAARAAVAVAQQQYDSARQSLVQVLVADYETGGSAGNSVGVTSTASLFTAADPGEVIQAGADREMVTRFQTQVTQQLTAALAARSGAEARQRQAVGEIEAQTARLGQLRAQAQHALADANSTLRSLQADLRVAKLTQTQADVLAASFLGGWSAADPARAAALDAQYRKLAASAATLPAARNTGTWTAAAGQTAAYRAIGRLGTPYAWAGGTAAGPSRGVCAGDGAQNDCNVVGFDCSGLALYAWAPYLALPHLASAQYADAGRVHPDVAALLPGDLVFWSSDGTAAGIHHVAIYVGNGNVVQAPQSGDVVRITPLADVTSGYFGATRPFS
jgi:cell wall-associated NlpC family hydrolase